MQMLLNTELLPGLSKSESQIAGLGGILWECSTA